jgi:hypothetical protein
MNTLRILSVVRQRGMPPQTASKHIEVIEVVADGYDWYNLGGMHFITVIGIEHVPERFRQYVLARVRMPISSIPPEGILHHALQEQLARDTARLNATVTKSLEAINEQLEKHNRRVEASVHIADRRGQNG